MSSWKKILAIAVGLTFTSPAYAVEEGYGLRTIIDYNEQPSSITSPYKHVYSLAMITKGAAGYSNITNFKNLFLTLQQAHEKEQLTPEGEELLTSVQAIAPRLRELSATRLTNRGSLQVKDLGKLFAQNRLELLMSTKTYDNDIPLLFEYNGDQLSLDTGENFVLGMVKALPADTQLVYQQEEEQNHGDIEKLLSFYDTNVYKRYTSSYPDLEKALGRLKVAKQTKSYIDIVINRIFKQKYANEISHIGIMVGRENYAKIEAEDFVSYVYNFWRFLPSLSQDTALKYTELFDVILPKDERRYWARYEDAEYFYKYGPGFSNQQMSVPYAQRLFHEFNDVVSTIGDDLSGGVKLYFVDAKAMVAYLSLIQGEVIGDSIDPKLTFDMRNGAFQMEKLVPLNSILIWDIYRSASGEAFASVKHNGNIIQLRASCGATMPNGLYKWSQLQACLDSNTNSDAPADK